MAGSEESPETGELDPILPEVYEWAKGQEVRRIDDRSQERPDEPIDPSLLRQLAQYNHRQQMAKIHWRGVERLARQVPGVFDSCGRLLWTLFSFVLVAFGLALVALGWAKANDVATVLGVVLTPVGAVSAIASRRV